MKRRYARPRKGKAAERARARKELGKRLCAYRVLASLTQSQLARALGWEPSLVNHMEAGRQGATLEQLRKLAAHYGLTVDELTDTSRENPALRTAHNP